MDKILIAVSPAQIEWQKRDNEIIGVKIFLQTFHIIEHPALHALMHEEMKKDDK